LHWCLTNAANSALQQGAAGGHAHRGPAGPHPRYLSRAL